ncbi:MAG: glutathione peroxidase [Bacteroidota bacterium]|jgi:glutathione peroxidase
MHLIQSFKFKSSFALAFLFLIGCSCSSSKIQADMSARQKALKSFYPTLTKITRFFGVKTDIKTPPKNVSAPASLYDYSFEGIAGDTLSMKNYTGKKLVIVNTASDCGYTGQYEELQQLYDQEKGKIEIIGFPANDFKQQEKGSNEAIAAFCKKNYGVTFPLASKAVVVKGKEQHQVFNWLSDPAKNGWNGRDPVWNFSKYIIDEKGNLVGYFDPGVSPLSKEFLAILHAPQS